MKYKEGENELILFLLECVYTSWFREEFQKMWNELNFNIFYKGLLYKVRLYYVNKISRVDIMISWYLVHNIYSNINIRRILVKLIDFNSLIHFFIIHITVQWLNPVDNNEYMYQKMLKQLMIHDFYKR